MPHSNEASIAAGTTLVLPALRPGDCIGSYRLVQQIGEGGCGIVYMAHQQEPLYRDVAVKVIKLGMDTRSVIARFEIERQTLALMDHPNIAKVLDAGATNTGRPFFVMELLRGTKITDYCDQNNVATRERLDLFVQVCRGIQHAHQKGVIHRDIKPSNILVMVHDGLPVPKVIDFGIAKATTGQMLNDKTIFTAFEQFIGTPAYMSPEQAEMGATIIDRRSDIYSLGILLYELLTGTTPFEKQKLLKVGLDEMRRTIREEEPVRPSTRLSTMTLAEASEVARRRQAEPPKLIQLVRGDLDWIVLKALEKDRVRRYETAESLAMDVQRYLNNEQVAASPQSHLRRFRSVARREKLVLGTGMAVGSAVIIGLGVSAWLIGKEREARRRAVAAEQAPERLRLESKLNQLSSLASELRIQGRLPEAEVLFREVIEIQKKMLGGEHPEVASSLDNLADVLNREGELAKAEISYREALGIRERTLPDDWRTFNNQSVLGGILLGQKKYAEAEPLLLSGYEGMKQRQDKISVASKPYLIEAIRRLVLIYEATSRLEQETEWKQKLLKAEKTQTENQTHSP